MKLWKKANAAVSAISAWIGLLAAVSAAMSLLVSKVPFLSRLNFAEYLLIGIGITMVMALVASVCFATWRYFRPIPMSEPAIENARTFTPQPPAMSEEQAAAILKQMGEAQIQMSATLDWMGRFQTDYEGRIDALASSLAGLESMTKQAVGSLGRIQGTTDMTLQYISREKGKIKNAVEAQGLALSHQIDNLNTAIDRYVRDTLLKLSEFIERERSKPYSVRHRYL